MLFHGRPVFVEEILSMRARPGEKLLAAAAWLRCRAARQVRMPADQHKQPVRPAHVSTSKQEACKREKTRICAFIPPLGAYARRAGP